MAFQSMISGAECSTSVNPLSQLLKHSERDPTLRHDASLINSHPNSIPSIRENVSRSNGTTNQEFEQFHSSNPGNLNPFGVEALRREIHAVPLRNGSPQSISNDWLAQYPVGHVGPGPEGTTFQDLQDMESAFHRPSANGEPTGEYDEAYKFQCYRPEPCHTHSMVSSLSKSQFTFTFTSCRSPRFQSDFIQVHLRRGNVRIPFISSR